VNWVFIAVFTAYVLVGTLIALASRRYFLGTLREYYTSGGRIGALLTAGAYAATTYSAFMMIGLVGLSYNTGVGALGFELTYLASTVFLLSTLGYRVWRLSKKRGWISPSQMLSDLYGSRVLGLAVAVVYLFAMLPYLAAQIRGLEIIFEYGGLGEGVALVASALLIYGWIFVAGMWSVATTDLYQGVIMLASGLAYLAWILLALVPGLGVDLTGVATALSSSGYLGLTGFWAPPVFLAYTIPWMFFAVTNPQVVAKLYLPRDGRSYWRSVMYFFVYGLTYTLIAVLVGLLARGLAVLGRFPGSMPGDNVTPTLLAAMDPLLGSLVAISIIAAAVSTANSIVLAVSGSVLTSTSRRGNLLLARVIDAVLVAASTLLAWARIGVIVDLSVLTSVILLPLAPVTIAGVLLWEKTGRASRLAALLSIVSGVSLATYYAATLGPRKAFTTQVLGMPISGLALLVSTIIITVGVWFS
jgi:SSS family solute:Na+ symporter